MVRRGGRKSFPVTFWKVDEERGIIILTRWINEIKKGTHHIQTISFILLLVVSPNIFSYLLDKHAEKEGDMIKAAAGKNFPPSHPNSFQIFCMFSISINMMNSFAFPLYI